MTAQGADASEQLPHLFAGVVDAGEMRQRRQAMLALDAVHNHQRLVARAAARAVGHGTEIRFDLKQRGNVLFEEGQVAFLRPGREKFKRDDRPPRGVLGRVNVADELHYGRRIMAQKRERCQVLLLPPEGPDWIRTEKSGSMPA